MIGFIYCAYLEPETDISIDSSELHDQTDLDITQKLYSSLTIDEDVKLFLAVDRGIILTVSISVTY